MKAISAKGFSAQTIATEPARSTRGSALALLTLSASIAAILAQSANATPYAWTSGNYGAGASPFPLPPTLNTTDILTITPIDPLEFNGSGQLLTNNGTVNDLGATIYFENGGAVTNNGTWDATAAGGEFTDGGNGGSFTNTGTFENTSTGNFLINTGGSFEYIDDGGTLNASLGSIIIAGGNASFTGTTFEGASGVNITNSATFGGTLTSNNDALQLQAGNFSTTAAGATLKGTSTISGGSLLGTWTVASDATLNNSATAVINGASVTNNGTLAVTSGGYLFFANGGVLTNTGTVNVTGDVFFSDGGNGGTFKNSGTFENTAANGIEVNTSGSFGFLDNGGTINASAGTITINGGNASFTNTNFTGMAQGDVIAAGGTFTGSIASTSNALLLQAGTFASGGTGATLTGSSTISGGTLQGTWNVASGATVTNTGTFVINGAGTDVTNNGTLNVPSGGYVYLSNGGALTNNNVINTTGDVFFNDGGNGGTFQNNATFENTGANNIEVNTSGSFGFVDNGGTINASGGAITFSGGNTSFTNTHFAGIAQGDVINGTSTFAGTINSASNALLFQAGTYVSGSTAATLTGTATISGGSLQGAWIVAGGATLNNPSTFVINGNGTMLTNQGTIDITGNGYVFLNNGAVLDNVSAINVSGNTFFADGGNGGTFENFGKFNNTSPASSGPVDINTSGSFAFVNESGATITTSSGSTTNIQGNNITFQDNSLFKGSGTTAIYGNATFNGKFSVDSTSTLVLNAGNVTGVATPATATGATLTGPLTWSGATLQGLWDFTANSTVTGNAGGAINGISGGTTVTNNGIINWTTSSNLGIANGAVLVNNGTLNVSNNAYVVDDGNGGVLENYGKFTNTYGGNVDINTTGSFSFVNESGATINTGPGGTTVLQGNNMTFNDNSLFTGAGSAGVYGNASFNGKFSVASGSTLVFNGGTLIGVATLATPTGATLSGALTWSGATLQGMWDFSAGSVVTANAGADINGATTVTNNGTVNWTTSSNLNFSNGGVMVNNGVFNVSNNAYLGDGGNGGSFVNNGLFEKTDASLTNIGATGSFTGIVNNGVIQAAAGTVGLGSAYTNTGTLSGTATFTAGSLTNNHIVAPGTFNPTLTMTTPGTLNLTGNYVQGSQGALQIGLLSYQNVNNGLFAVAGTATLAGAIDVNCIGTCSFTKGEMIEVLSTTGGISGSIGSVVATGFSNNNDFLAQTLNGNEYLDVEQNITAAVPEPETYALMLAGGGLLFAMSRRRSRTTRLLLASRDSSFLETCNA